MIVMVSGTLSSNLELTLSEFALVIFLLVSWDLPTLLLNEGIPRAYRGKKLRLKNILFFPSKSEGITLKF